MKRFEQQLSFALGLCLSSAACIACFILLVLTESWLLALGIDSLIFLISFLVVYRMMIGMTEPWGKVVFALRRLADGDYRYRVEPSTDRFGVLVPYINELGQKLEKTRQSVEDQRDQLNTIVENAASPLILIDDKKRIIHANTLFKKMFQLSDDELAYQPYDALLPYPQLVDIIRATFANNQPLNKQEVLAFSIERRHFDIHTAPIQLSSQPKKGVVVVLHDITELKKLEKMRQDFVANVSHELKTPVTSIKGFAETLLENDGQNPEVVRQFLQIIWKESERLQHLIKDLLELSKIEQESFRLNWETVDLQDVLHDTLILLKDKAEKKQIAFTVRTEGDTRIAGDSERLKQMFMNVINNAIAYSPPESTVTVELKEKGDVVDWVTADEGIGIEEEEIPRIFERFYRVDKARSRDSGGTGLGLAIVKHLAEAHRAKIAVKSQPGHGTTFTISFRKHRPEPPAREGEAHAAATHP